MYYYVENIKTGLGKYLSWFDGQFTNNEWVEIYSFYSNNSNFIIIVINE